MFGANPCNMFQILGRYNKKIQCNSNGAWHAHDLRKLNCWWASTSTDSPFLQALTLRVSNFNRESCAHSVTVSVEKKEMCQTEFVYVGPIRCKQHYTPPMCAHLMENAALFSLTARSRRCFDFAAQLHDEKKVFTCFCAWELSIIPNTAGRKLP